MIVGITGYQRLENENAWSWVEGAIRSALAQITAPPIGINSLAIGADQLFADLILECGGELHAVLPFPSYMETFRPGPGRDHYFVFLERAASVEVLLRLATDEESYFAAGRRVIDASDRTIAVWNGKKDAGLGGTGDVVRYALERGKEILHINP